MQAATGTSREEIAPQRAAKRRARDGDETDEASEEGFEPMEIDRQGTRAEPIRDQETDDEDQSTPQPLEEEETTATDDELDRSMEAASATARLKHVVASNDASLPQQTAPPRRELPFTPRDPSLTKGSRPDPSEAVEETAGETDDDEL